MAKVLFTWALGRGLGHRVRYKALIASLVDDGHEVFYLARNAEKVRQVNPQTGACIEELQPEFAASDRHTIKPSIASYGTLPFVWLFRSDKLTVRPRRWLAVI